MDSQVYPAVDGVQLALDGVRWHTYLRLSDEVARGGTRVTFDRGRMQIARVSMRHQQVRCGLTRIVAAYADAIGVEAEGFGSMTIRRPDLSCALEPDECFYVANAPTIIGRRSTPGVDLTAGLPPDLVIEIDVPPPELPRRPILAAMGVPEVWWFDGSAVVFLSLVTDGNYVAVKRSAAFPRLSVGLVNEWLAVALTDGQSAAAREVRRHLADRTQQ